MYIVIPVGIYHYAYYSIAWRINNATTISGNLRQYLIQSMNESRRFLYEKVSKYGRKRTDRPTIQNYLEPYQYFNAIQILEYNIGLCLCH